MTETGATGSDSMALRSGLVTAVRAGLNADRNNAAKWTPLYRFFQQHLGVGTGRGGGDVVGKLITEVKQVGNRCDEMAKSDPKYAVISVLSPVTAGQMLAAMRQRGRLPSLRCVLFLRETTPDRLVVFESDPVVERIAAMFPELEPQPHARLGVDPDGQTGGASSASATATPTAATSPSSGHVPSVLPVPIEIDPRVERMVRLAILSSPAVILVGPPGTGKTTLLRQVVDRIAADPAAHGFSVGPGTPIWSAPQENWTTTDLIGGETIDAGELRFRPGHVLDAIATKSWLILDEVNRADMDRIFGGLLTWLSGQEVTIGSASTAVDSPSVLLGWADTADSSVEHEELLDDPTGDGDAVRYLAGTEWRLLGTYNALDAQRVFRFGQALGRRFLRVPIPAPNGEQFRTALANMETGLSSALSEAIASLYECHLADAVTTLGPALFFRMAAYIEAGISTEAESLVPEDSLGGEPESGADLQAAADSVGDEARTPALQAEDGADLLSESTDRATEESGHPPLASISVVERELLAEAYLVNVGTWLRQMEDELPALGDAAVNRHQVLSRAEWNWIVELSRVLA